MERAADSGGRGQRDYRPGRAGQQHPGRYRREGATCEQLPPLNRSGFSSLPA
jgi:hypothetical protein